MRIEYQFKIIKSIFVIEIQLVIERFFYFVHLFWIGILEKQNFSLGVYFLKGFILAVNRLVMF